MTTLRKILKSNSIDEMCTNIPYSFLEWLACILISLFFINSNLKLIVTIIGSPSTNGDFYLYYWHNYNYWCLILGLITLLIYLRKCILEDKAIKLLSLIKSNPIFFLLALFCLLMTISTIANGFPEYSLFGYTYRREGLFGHLSYVVYFLLGAVILKKIHTNFIFKTFYITASINIIATAIDYALLDKKYNLAQGIAVFANANHYGYYLVVAAMFFALHFVNENKKSKKISSILMFIITIFVLLINDTFGCQLALFVGILFTFTIYLIAQKKYIPYVFCTMVIIPITFMIGYVFSNTIHDNINRNFSVFSYNVESIKEEHNDSTGRKNLWKHTLGYISEKPLLGFSADGTHDRLIEDTNCSGRVHNEFLHYAVCFGIPAAIIYIIFIFLIYLRGLKYKNSLTDINLTALCLAFTYLTSSFVGNTMHYTTPLVYIMLGLGYYSSNKLK